MSGTHTSLYFAYGANLNLRTMALRCPGAYSVDPVQLEGHSLRFHGVATVVRSEGAVVHGALWRLSPACIVALDHCEGWPTFYGKRRLRITHPDGRTQRAMTYVLRPALPVEPPHPDYLEEIRGGYQDFDLPMWSLDEALRKAASAEDEALQDLIDADSWALEQEQLL